MLKTNTLQCIVNLKASIAPCRLYNPSEINTFQPLTFNTAMIGQFNAAR